MVSVSRSQSRPQPAATRRCRGSRPGASCAGRARSRYRPDSETMAARAAPRHARTTTHGAILRQSEQPTKAPEIPPEGVDRAAATKTTGTSLAIPRVKRSMPAGTSPDSGGSAAGEKPFQEVPTCLRRGFRKPQPRLPGIPRSRSSRSRDARDPRASSSPAAQPAPSSAGSSPRPSTWSSAFCWNQGTRRRPLSGRLGDPQVLGARSEHADPPAAA